MRHILFSIIALFLFINLANAQSSLRLGMLVGNQRVNIKNTTFGKVSSKRSSYSEFYLNSSIYLGRHSLIFGIGQRTHRTNIEYVTQQKRGSFLGDLTFFFFGLPPSSSVTPVYHAAERIELNNRYLIIPLGIELILSKSKDDFYFYLLPQINGNIITKNQRSFHITENYDFLPKAKADAESFKNIPFESFVNFSIELGGKVKQKRWGFGGGLKYRSGNSMTYGRYGGVKSSITATVFMQYYLTPSRTTKK